MAITPERQAQLDAMIAKQKQGGTALAMISPERKAFLDSLIAQQRQKEQQSRSVSGMSPGEVLSGIGGFAKEIAKPFLRAGTAVTGAAESTGNIISGGLNTALGDTRAAEYNFAQANKDINTGGSLGRLFGVKPYGTESEETQGKPGVYKPEETPAEFAKGVIGTGLEIGSYFVPVGTSGKAAFQAYKTGGMELAWPVLKQALQQGAKYGALAGGLSSGGRALSEDDDLATGIIRTGTGIGVGGALGAAIPALSFGARVGAKGVKDTAVKLGSYLAPKAAGPAKYLTAQASGLSPKTVENIVRDPEIADDVLRGNPIEKRQELTDRAKTAFEEKLDELSDTGKIYDSIRQQNGPLPIEQGRSGYPKFVEDIAQKFGLPIDDDGVIKPLTSGTTLKQGDAAAFQKFLDQYGHASTSNEFLNARSALDDLGNYSRDPGKTKAIENFARILRREYDRIGKEYIPGLAEVDATYGPQREFVDSIRKMLFDRNGELKDNAISTLTNSTNVNNASKLARLEELMPGITREVNVLKAIDDVVASSGQKTGTYLRGALGGAGILSQNPVLLALSIFGTPENFVKAIQAYGYTNQGKFATDALTNKIVNGGTLTAGQQAVVSEVIQTSARAFTAAISNGVAAALKEGYTKEEIDKFLQGQY